MIIDSHQHFWKLSRGDYSWMTPDMKKLYKDFFNSKTLNKNNNRVFFYTLQNIFFELFFFSMLQVGN